MLIPDGLPSAEGQIQELSSPGLKSSVDFTALQQLHHYEESHLGPNTYFGP